MNQPTVHIFKEHPLPRYTLQECKQDNMWFQLPGHYKKQS